MKKIGKSYILFIVHFFDSSYLLVINLVTKLAFHDKVSISNMIGCLKFDLTYYVFIDLPLFLIATTFN